MRIVMVDCDHDSFQPEIELAREQSVEFVIAHSIGDEELIANASGADGILMQYAPIFGALLDAMPRLKAIGRYGVGVDTIDVNAATYRSVAVCNVPDYGTESVSDHAIALALSAARGIVRLDREVHRGSNDLALVKPLHEISGRTFGVVGAGAIGRATARKAMGLGYRVIGFDTAAQPGTVGPGGIEMTTLAELLRAADVVSIHVPLTQQTHHLIGADELSRMRNTAVLVNTSRGGVVDTDALVSALREGGIAGAALDVLEQEPIAAGHPLLDLDTVILTPHAAWYTEESYLRLKQCTLQNVIDVCLGRRPRNIFNPDVLVGAGAP